MKSLTIDPNAEQPPTRDFPSGKTLPERLPQPKEVNVHPSKAGGENASLYFVGTATTILEWEGLRLMTDPNFLHAGDHVHLGPGVTGTRLTNPAVDLHDLPNIHLVLLSHYHADHFDQEVEASLRRDLPIISTPHAKASLTAKGPEESFSQVFDLNFFESMMVNISSPTSTTPGKIPRIKVSGMPGKHVPDGVFGTLNDFIKAVPPTNGWMVELGYGSSTSNPQDDKDDDGGAFECGYRIYISGDTLMVDDLKAIPEHYKGQNIDLMLVHLGGTTVPSPSLPLLMITMDGKQGLELVRLICPDVTIPIHFDDYDVFKSPLSDFKAEIDKAGLSGKVVYLDRGDGYRFKVQQH